MTSQTEFAATPNRRTIRISRVPPLLRRALVADAAISGTTGLAMAVLADPLAGLLGLPAALLREAGLLLLPFAAFVGYLAARQRLASAAVWAVIAANALWAIDSIALLFTGWVEPTGLGMAFVLAQGAAVAALAELEYLGLRRSSAAA